MDWTRIITNALEAAVGIQAVVFALAAIGLNVHFGYTGLLNFGQSGFLAVAAYGMAVTVQTYDMSLWLGIVVGLFISIITLWVPVELKNVGALGILIVILLVRPQGILGRAQRVG